MTQVTSKSPGVSGKRETQQHVISWKLRRRKSSEKLLAGVQTKWPMIKQIGHRWDLQPSSTASEWTFMVPNSLIRFSLKAIEISQSGFIGHILYVRLEYMWQVPRKIRLNPWLKSGSSWEGGIQSLMKPMLSMGAHHWAHAGAPPQSRLLGHTGE